MNAEPPESLSAADAALPQHRPDQHDTATAVSSSPAVHASSFARELRQLQPVARRMLHLTDELLDGIDTFMASAHRINADERPLLDVLSDVLEDQTEQSIERFSESVVELSEDDIERLVKFYTRPDFQRYVKRMVGDGAMRRLRTAVSEDFDVLVGLIYRAADGLVPYAVAIENLAGVVDEDKVRKFINIYPASGYMIGMMFDFFAFVDTVVDKVMVREVMTVLAEERDRRQLETRDVTGLTLKVRAQISGRSRNLVEQVSKSLTRKLKGAKDALAHSADSNSQAANSLIEFIDRLFRQSFHDDHVLKWIAANYPDEGLTYDHHGRDKPTKRGQALCFLHGGQDVEQPSPIHLLVAHAIANVRDQLQQIKHADEGTEAEQRKVEDCLMVVECFIEFGCRLSWMGLSDDALRDLQARLDPPVKGEVAVQETGDATAGGAA